MMKTGMGVKTFNISTEINSEGTTLVEYIWIDGTQAKLRSKTRVVNKKVAKVEELECILVYFFSF